MGAGVSYERGTPAITRHMQMEARNVAREKPCNCRGTSLIRNTPFVGPYSSPMPRNSRTKTSSSDHATCNYRGTSLIRDTHPHRITVGPKGIGLL
jgi:hypothetical protein